MDKIREYIQHQFVEDYEYIKKFMDDVNKTFIKIGIDPYTNYNTFCLEIEEYIISIIKELNIDESDLTTDIIVYALNNMIKEKITKDKNFEVKIKNYFDKE